MRILMITHSSAPWTPHFARFFVERGDVLRLVSFAPFPLNGIESLEMDVVGVEPFDPNANKHLFITRVPRIRRIARDFRPDLVFAPYLISNGLTAVLVGRHPLVVAAVGSDVLDLQGPRSWNRRFRERVIRFVCRRADLVNSVSRNITDELLRLGASRTKLLEMPFGADTSQFSPDPAMPRPSATRFICTRKHEPIYDIPTVIESLARLKAAGRQFHCTFTSVGTYWEEHKAQARATHLEDSVTFTGNIPHGELPRLLRQADAYVSASRSDGTSVALLEAMASGLLPVVSDIPANRPWVKHGETGLLFEVGRSDRLAEALARAMDDADLRQRAFERNRSRVEEEGNMNRNMGRLAAVFEQLVSRSDRSAG